MTRVSQVDRRTQLIEAAIRVIQRDGIDRATTRAIATEAQAPLASIHYSFGSKEDILRAAFDHVVSELMIELAGDLDETAGLRSVIADLLRRVGQLLEDKRFVVVLLEISPSKDPWARIQMDQIAVYLTELLQHIAVASKQNEPPMGFATLGRLIFAVIDGVVSQFEVHGNITQATSDLAHMGTALGSLITDT
jgi:AcrR family transcriptional regulator